MGGDFPSNARVVVNAVDGNNTRVSGYAKGDRSYLGKDDVPLVALEHWSRLDVEEVKMWDYSVIRLDPAYARRVAQQLYALADYADGLSDGVGLD